MFFALSGYWIAQMWEQKYARMERPYLTFMVSRWWRLAPVFMTCIFLTWLTHLFLSIDTGLGDSLFWWLGQVPIVGSGLYGKILPPTWSLDVEMQFYLLAPLLVGIFATAVRWRVLAMVGALGLSLMILSAGIDPQNASLPVYLALFLAGIVIHQSSLKFTGQIAWGSVICFGTLTLVLLIIPMTRSGIWQPGSLKLAVEPSHFWPHAWWILGVIICLPFIAWNVRNASGKMDRILGDLSYPLYLFHWIPREIYYQVVGDGVSLELRAGWLVLNFAGAILGAVLIYYVVDRPMNRLRGAWVKAQGKTSPRRKAAGPEPTPSAGEMSQA